MGHMLGGIMHEHQLCLLREPSLAEEDDRYMCLYTDSRAGCVCLSFVINAETPSTEHQFSISWSIWSSPADVTRIPALTGCFRLMTSKRIYPGKMEYSWSFPVDCCSIWDFSLDREEVWPGCQLVLLAVHSCWSSYLDSSDTLLGYDVANSWDKNTYMKLLLWSDLIVHSFFPTDSSFSTNLVFKQK